MIKSNTNGLQNCKISLQPKYIYINKKVILIQSSFTLQYFQTAYICKLRNTRHTAPFTPYCEPYLSVFVLKFEGMISEGRK